MFSKYKVEIFLLIIFLAGLFPRSKYIEYVSIVYFLILLYAFFFFKNNKSILVFSYNYILPVIFFIFIILLNVGTDSSFMHCILSTAWLISEISSELIVIPVEAG